MLSGAQLFGFSARKEAQIGITGIAGEFRRRRRRPAPIEQSGKKPKRPARMCLLHTGGERVAPVASMCVCWFISTSQLNSTSEPHQEANLISRTETELQSPGCCCSEIQKPQRASGGRVHEEGPANEQNLEKCDASTAQYSRDSLLPTPKRE